MSSQNRVEGFRLSPQQRYFWSLQRATSFTYQVVATVSINGELRADVLQRALADIVERHEILRTTFHRPPGIKTPFQVISDEAQFSWQFTDLSGLGQEALPSKLENCVQAERNKPFDFERGPLLRASLYRTSPERHTLLISLPALCGDPVTIRNLISELGQEFADQPMQYADFAEWQNELLESSDEQADQGRNYWLELMARQV